MLYLGGFLLIVGLVGAVLLVVGFVASIALMTWDLLSDRDTPETETSEVPELSRA